MRDTSGMGFASPGSGYLTPAMESQLVACVHESLSLYLFENAQFLCERLVAILPTQVTQFSCIEYNACCQWKWTNSTHAHLQENINLLATCYFRSDQIHRAYNLLLGTAWLIAPHTKGQGGVHS